MSNIIFYGSYVRSEFPSDLSCTVLHRAYPTDEGPYSFPSVSNISKLFENIRSVGRNLAVSLRVDDGEPITASKNSSQPGGPASGSFTDPPDLPKGRIYYNHIPVIIRA